MVRGARARARAPARGRGGEGARGARGYEPAAAIARAREARARAAPGHERDHGRRRAARRDRHRARGLRPRRRARGRRPARHAGAGRAARRARRAARQARLADRPTAARGAPGRVAARCGHAGAKVAAALRGPPWASKKAVARAKKADAATLERALCVFADLEVEMRGGGDVQVDEGAAFSLALARARAGAGLQAPAAGRRPRRLGRPARRGTTTPSGRSSSRCARAWSPGRPRGPPGRARGRSRDCLKPPNGPASLSVSGSLIHTVPARISRMQRTAVSRSRV